MAASGQAPTSARTRQGRRYSETGGIKRQGTHLDSPETTDDGGDATEKRKKNKTITLRGAAAGGEKGRGGERIGRGRHFLFLTDEETLKHD